MFPCKYCEIFKNIFFEKHVRTSASVHFKIQIHIQHPAVKYLRYFLEKLLVRRLTVQNTSPEKKKLLEGWTNFFLGTLLFRCAILLARPIEHTKNRWSKPKCSSNRYTATNTFFCYLLAKPDLQLSF